MKAIVSPLRTIVRKWGVFAYTLWIAIRIALIRIRIGRRLLIVMRSGGLGDIVASFPAVAALRLEHPQQCLIYLTRPEFVGIHDCGLPVDLVLPTYHGDMVAVFLRKFCDARSLKYLDELPGQVSNRNFVLELADSVGADLQGRDQPQIMWTPSAMLNLHLGLARSDKAKNSWPSIPDQPRR